MNSTYDVETSIYLDFAAGTPLDPRVLEAMRPFLHENFGNPSSIHQYGQRARKAVDEARQNVIDLLGAFSVHEIIFTGSGTESCNMAIFGAAMAREDHGKHLVISAIEHPAVREAAFQLRDLFGFELTEVLPGADGIVLPESIESALRKDTILVSLMLANNEVGTIQPIQGVAALCREKGILFHTDACQAPGYVNFGVEDLKPDLLSLNGSKLYGPKGVGMLYVREGVKIMPMVLGGGQEFRMRGGTENVANIVGFAKALQIALEEADQIQPRVATLTKELKEALLKLKGVSLNGHAEQRLPNNVNVHVEGVSGESLVMRLDMEGLAASSGSACSSGKTEPSHVLLAMGQSKEAALQSLRLSLGRTSTPEGVQAAIKILNRVIPELQKRQS